MIRRRTRLKVSVSVVLVLVVLTLSSVEAGFGWDPDATPSSAHAGACLVPEFVSSATQFSLFWFTDTQYLSMGDGSLFKDMTNWIASNYTACNGKMVVHTGDIVQD